jgi:hypothetical protein
MFVFEGFRKVSLVFAICEFGDKVSVRLLLFLLRTVAGAVPLIWFVQPRMVREVVKLEL